MADNMDIEITGLDEVCANLERVPTDLVHSAFASALTAACVPVVQALYARVPVGVTGALKGSIVVDVALHESGKGGIAKIGFGKKMGDIARYVELGHQQYSHKPKHKLIGNVPPHPFIRPALEAAAAESVEAFSDTLKVLGDL